MTFNNSIQNMNNIKIENQEIVMEEQSQAWEKGAEKIEAIKAELAKVVIGQDVIVKQMLVSLLSNGHCHIVGVPGLAKTLLVHTLGRILGLSFNRIQFTPDMMPSDIIVL